MSRTFDKRNSPLMINTTLSSQQVSPLKLGIFGVRDGSNAMGATTPKNNQVGMIAALALTPQQKHQIRMASAVQRDSKQSPVKAQETPAVDPKKAAVLAQSQSHENLPTVNYKHNMRMNPSATQTIRLESILQGEDSKTVRTYSRAQSIASARIQKNLETQRMWEAKKIKMEKAVKRQKEYLEYSIQTKHREASHERAAKIQQDKKLRLR